MAGVRLLTKEEKELISLYGKPVTFYHIHQAFSRKKPRFLSRCLSYKIEARRNKMATPSGIAIYNYMNCKNIILRSQVVRKTSCPFCQMKCGSLSGVKHHLRASHALFDFNFRLSENYHPNFDISLKPDAFKNGVLNYDFEEHNLVDFSIHRLESRKSGQVYGPTGRKYCEIYEKYSDNVPRDKENELPHENGNISSSPARTRLSEETPNTQTITQPAIGQCSKAKGRRATGRKPQRVQAERTNPLESRQFYHSRTLQPMTMEEVLSEADSDNDDDEDFKDFLERMKLDRLEDASDEEKRFMWLWNTFMRKQTLVVDKQVPWACEEFIKVHAKELVTSNLVWQWRLFAIDVLCIKYGLIDAKTMDKCSIILQIAEAPPEEAAALAEAKAAAEEAAAVAEAEAAAKKAAAVAAASAAKVAAAAAKAAAAAEACKTARKSARIQMKKNKQEAAAASKANANGNEPQPMEIDEEEH